MSVGRDQYRGEILKPSENLVWLQVFPRVGAEFPDGFRIWTEGTDQLGSFHWEQPSSQASGLVVFGEYQMTRFLAGFPIRIEPLGLWLRKGTFGWDQVMAAQEEGFL